jgi:hypothetical protein
MPNNPVNAANASIQDSLKKILESQKELIRPFFALEDHVGYEAAVEELRKSLGITTGGVRKTARRGKAVSRRSRK